MKFIEDVKPDDKDLPWANEYVESYGQEEDIAKVFKLIPGSKGILVITEHFKGFIFKGSSTYDYLLDAIEAWKKDGRLPFCLFAQVLANGKIRIGVDDKSECIAIVDKRGTTDFKFPKDEDGLRESRSSNPFIPGSPAPTMSASTKATDKSSPKAKTGF